MISATKPESAGSPSDPNPAMKKNIPISGIFFHSAPWSIGDQGRRNVSHGCLNLSPENAKWVFDNSKQGDVVIVKNSGGPVLESWDGFGDWQVPWATWVQGNR